MWQGKIIRVTALCPGHWVAQNLPDVREKEMGHPQCRLLQIMPLLIYEQSDGTVGYTWWRVFVGRALETQRVCLGTRVWFAKQQLLVWLGSDGNNKRCSDNSWWRTWIFPVYQARWPSPTRIIRWQMKSSLTKLGPGNYQEKQWWAIRKVCFRMWMLLFFVSWYVSKVSFFRYILKSK